MQYDPFSAAFQADPFPVYQWMRDEAPVYYSEKWNWWALVPVRRRPRGGPGPRDVPQLRGHRHRRHGQGPERTWLSARPRQPPSRPGACVVQPFFLPRRIAEQEAGVRATVRELVGRWRDRGAVDLAQELAWPMPNEVFFNLLGLPSASESASDRRQLEQWVHELKDREPDNPHLTPRRRRRLPASRILRPLAGRTSTEPAQ